MPTIKGKDVVSETKPQAIINGKIMLVLKPKCLTITNIMGGKIKAAPSFAKKAATTVPNNMMNTQTFLNDSRLKPLPYEWLHIRKSQSHLT